MSALTIWKFPVLPTGTCEIDVPEPGQIVHVDRDPATGLMAFWAIVDPGCAKHSRRFQIAGTGYPLPGEATHRGSYVVGEFVWHLVEIGQ